MKLRIVINDSLSTQMHMQFTGGQMSITRRVIDIELTNEQIGQIALKKLGMDCGKPYFETVESTCLIDI